MESVNTSPNERGEWFLPLPAQAYETPDGCVVYPVMAKTHGVRAWHPAVDLLTGRCLCDCPAFDRSSKAADEAGVEPNVWLPESQCKHIAWLVETLRREGRLEAEEE